MLLNSIYDIMSQQAVHQKAAAAGKNKPSSGSVEGGKAVSKLEDTIKTPASKATYEAAAKAKGMKKIELEIAAAAGLLRPISPEPPPETNQNSNSFEDLLRIIEDLKNPPKPSGIDLFE